MKKLLALLLALTLSTGLFSACSPEEAVVDEPVEVAAVDVRALALKGPTAMGMVSFMDKAEKGELVDNNYTFNIIADTSEVAALLTKEEVDIAAVPANLASVLYNNTDGAIQVLALNTLGVLYIVENGETVMSVDDLKGKTIYATGKGATPEYALRYILSQNGIDPDVDVTIEWKSEAAEVLAQIAATENAIAMLPQPFVTTALMQNENLKVVLDLTQEWDKTQSDSDMPSSLITGVIVARKDFVINNPEAVTAFLSHYNESVDFVNNSVEEGAVLVGQYDIVPEAVALQAIPACNIVYVDGLEMYSQLSGYLNVLFTENPASVGGALPLDDFYYGQ